MGHVRSSCRVAVSRHGPGVADLHGVRAGAARERPPAQRRGRRRLQQGRPRHQPSPPSPPLPQWSRQGQVVAVERTLAAPRSPGATHMRQLLLNPAYTVPPALVLALASVPTFHSPRFKLGAYYRLSVHPSHPPPRTLAICRLPRVMHCKVCGPLRKLVSELVSWWALSGLANWMDSARGGCGVHAVAAAGA